MLVQNGTVFVQHGAVQGAVQGAVRAARPPPCSCVCVSRQRPPFVCQSSTSSVCVSESRSRGCVWTRVCVAHTKDVAHTEDVARYSYRR